jgi:uncharacterized membrane protein YtjA (UPF0391 family)
MGDREVGHPFNIAAESRRNQRRESQKKGIGTAIAISDAAGTDYRHLERNVDIILLLGIILLVLALLGFSGVIAALESIAVILLIIAVIVIAWRVITGRRPV